MMYEVTAAPPSWALGCHVREMLFLDTSVTMGLCGGPGSWKGSAVWASDESALSGLAVSGRTKTKVFLRLFQKLYAIMVPLDSSRQPAITDLYMKYSNLKSLQYANICLVSGSFCREGPSKRQIPHYHTLPRVSQWLWPSFINRGSFSDFSSQWLHRTVPLKHQYLRAEHVADNPLWPHLSRSPVFISWNWLCGKFSLNTLRVFSYYDSCTQICTRFLQADKYDW